MTAPRHPSEGTGAGALHFGIAEQGKVLALAGRHREALGHYRAALHLAARAGAPQVVARHYFHCAVESLEHLGAWAEVADLCTRAIEAAPPAERSEFHRRDRAWLLERRGLARLSAAQTGAAETGAAQTGAAEADLRAALELAGPAGAPLSAEVVGWLRSRYTIAPARLAEARRRHGAQIVRRDSVDPSRAIPLPTSPPGDPT